VFIKTRIEEQARGKCIFEQFFRKTDQHQNFISVISGTSARQETDGVESPDIHRQRQKILVTPGNSGHPRSETIPLI
jgi:hypothetical protein